MLSATVMCILASKVTIFLSAVHFNSKCPAEFDYQLHTTAWVPVGQPENHKKRLNAYFTFEQNRKGFK